MSNLYWSPHQVLKVCIKETGLYRPGSLVCILLCLAANSSIFYGRDVECFLSYCRKYEFTAEVFH